MRPILLARYRAIAALTLGGVALHSADAQQTRQRVTSTSSVSSARCVELTSSPTMLTDGPEGRALLRLKRELDNAAVLVGQRTDSNRTLDIRRISRAQRGVDSLMQIVVRYKNPDGSDGESITIRRGDSIPRMVGGRLLTPNVMLFETMENGLRAVTPILEGSLRTIAPMMDSSLRMMGPEIEIAIRSMQPQIAAFAEAARSGTPSRAPLRSSSPAGWLGMHLSESKITVMSPDGPLTNYCDYPVIEAVDAGSPVEKAGIIAGDTVTAYNGRDVRLHVVNYGELLVPGQVLRMRVRRGARTREYPVTVAARPQSDRNVSVVRSTCSTGSVCEMSSTFSFNVVPPSPPPPASPPVPLPPTGLLFPSTGIAVIAGAQLSVVDEDFAQSLGVEPGLLVMRAPVGTPVADAGIRAGEVIRAVNGAPVRDFTVMRRAFSASGSREVKLTVVARGAAPRTVTVRW